MSDKDFKSGFVAIIGKPNVGKSTILNRLLNKKIAIVSEKPETTRDNIQGILTTEGYQIIFIDTPGIHRPRLLLGKLMVQRAKSALMGSDLILFVLDMTSCIDEEDRIIFNLLKDTKKRAILLLNKIDLVKKSLALPVIEEAAGYYNFQEMIPISATKGDNMEVVLLKIIENIKKGPEFYPSGQTTDKDAKFMTAETIREHILEFTRQEVPHSIAVLVEELIERSEKLTYIKATVFVERDSQKGIIIGQAGNMLKKIGQQSRLEIERFLNKRIYLDLQVNVYKNWRKDPTALRLFGYQ